MAKVLSKSEGNQQAIEQAFHASGGLRDLALTKLRRYRDRARGEIAVNEIPDLSEYMRAVHFRNWVFQAEPQMPDISWEDSLAEAHLKANTRIYELSATDLVFTAHEQMSYRMEVAAIHDFLNRTRALLK
jgi:hypothetical protein